jgi:type I restriction enzyme, S subunit
MSIPKGWNESCFRDVATIANGQVDPRREPYCEYFHIGPENIESGTNKAKNLQKTKDLHLISGKYLFDEKAIVYSKIRPNLNKLCLPNFVGICSADMYPVWAKEDIIDRNYLFQFMTSEFFLKFATAASSRTGLPKINRQELDAIKILYPPLREQCKVAEILGVWDESIDLLEKLIMAKRKLKQGLMQQLLTGKRRFKRFDGSDWKKISIGEIAYVDKKSLGNNTPRDYSFLYISLSDIENGIISANLQNLCFAEAPSRARRLVIDNDILMATVRPNLKSFAMVKNGADRYVVSTGFAVITTKKDYSPGYLYQYIFSNHIEKQINALVTGSNYPAINSTEIKGLIVNCPRVSASQNVAKDTDYWRGLWVKISEYT